MFEFIEGAQGEGPSYDVLWKQHPEAPPQNKILVFGGPKGGSGKTTNTLVAAGALAARGARVLVIDATEGQGHLTLRFAPDTGVLGSPMQDSGFGEMIRDVKGSLVRNPSLPYRDLLKLGQDAALNFLRRITEREERCRGERGAVTFLRSLSVDPDSDATMDFLPCGSVHLIEVLRDSYLEGYATVRQALVRSVLDALIGHYGGWDFIFIDIMPSTTSNMVRAVLGVADRLAIVVDSRSSGPLAGMEKTVEDVEEIRKQSHRPNPHLLAGFILNKVKPGGQEDLVVKIERLEIQAFCQQHGMRVIGEVQEMRSLTMLGFNQQAVAWLEQSFGGKIPSAAEVMDMVFTKGGLTEAQLDAISIFQNPVEFYQQTGMNEMQVGVRHLAARRFGTARKNLLAEERSIIPTVLALAGEDELVERWDARAATDASPLEK